MFELCNEELNRIDDFDLDSKEEKIQQMKKIKKRIELNQNQKDVSEYYKKVQDLLNIEYKSELRVEEYEKFKTFFNLEMYKEEFIDGSLAFSKVLEEVYNTRESNETKKVIVKKVNNNKENK